MLDQYPLGASLPASDIQRAKDFYQDTLGLKPSQEMGDEGAMYETGGAQFMVYPSTFAGTNQATAAAWLVPEIEAVVADLKSRGVTFEEYDMDDFKTVDGVATTPDGGKAAWFKDSEGNILGLFQQA
jgi:predicted enzyme related to lactoylglutathione lyase